MTDIEREDCTRLLLIAAYMSAHMELVMPTITPNSVCWHITGRPVMEAAVLAIDAGWKVIYRDTWTVVLAGYDSALGQVLLTADRYETGPAERDWAALGVAVPEAVSAS